MIGRDRVVEWGETRGCEVCVVFCNGVGHQDVVLVGECSEIEA